MLRWVWCRTVRYFDFERWDPENLVLGPGRGLCGQLEGRETERKERPPRQWPPEGYRSVTWVFRGEVVGIWKYGSANTVRERVL